MIIKRLKDCKKIISADNAILREIFHAAKGRFKFRYSLAHAVVKQRMQTKPHKLKTSEVYYILKGNAVMYIDRKSRRVSAGCAIYIRPCAEQYIKNRGEGDLEFICIVDPAWRKRDEEIL